MHPSEHRALRELAAAVRQLADHWRTLADNVGEDALRAGAEDAAAIADEVAAAGVERDLPTRPAAGGLGSRIATTRNRIGDALLERNQALRLAVLDAVHVTVLAEYVAGLAGVRGDEALRDAASGWAGRLRPHAEAVERAAIASSGDPDRAIEPAVPGLAGRAGHGLNMAFGSLGERVDRTLAGRS